ncbi:Hypothetical predicted protein [Podarcis lilfordi]|uniref:Uncharacterized protein n=1 Tax=Podarcis lilfordi TaxID=74358 RepID=A0AA35JZC5_9SAUR|nr:Hypothetical predicted protein [Podarcis lilfordi]
MAGRESEVTPTSSSPDWLPAVTRPFHQKNARMILQGGGGQPMRRFCPSAEKKAPNRWREENNPPRRSRLAGGPDRAPPPPPPRSRFGGEVSMAPATPGDGDCACAPLLLRLFPLPPGAHARWGFAAARVPFCAVAQWRGEGARAATGTAHARQQPALSLSGAAVARGRVLRELAVPGIKSALSFSCTSACARLQQQRGEPALLRRIHKRKGSQQQQQLFICAKYRVELWNSLPQEAALAITLEGN